MMTPDEENGAGATCRHHEGHEQKFEDHEQRIARLEDIMDRVRRRPPVWTTIVISVLVGIASAAATAAVMSWKGGGSQAAMMPEWVPRPRAEILDEWIWGEKAGFREGKTQSSTAGPREAL